MAGDRIARSVLKFIYIRVGGQIRWIYPPLNKPKMLPAMAQDRKELTDYMDFVDRYSKFSKWFYLIILGLTIPYYLLLYGASGHQFDPPTEDIISMIVVVVAFVTLTAYLMIKKKTGLGFNLMRVLVTITLLLTASGGLRIFLFMIQFDYGDDIGFIIRGLFYVIPVLFVLSTVMILLGLFKKVE